MPNLAQLLARCQPNTSDRYLPTRTIISYPFRKKSTKRAMNCIKRKTDFVTVKFNENEPHTTQEWWFIGLTGIIHQLKKTRML
jgi:hypothetical protein